MERRLEKEQSDLKSILDDLETTLKSEIEKDFRNSKKLQSKEMREICKEMRNSKLLSMSGNRTPPLDDGASEPDTASERVSARASSIELPYELNYGEDDSNATNKQRCESHV